jgi:hypothetical protein
MSSKRKIIKGGDPKLKCSNITGETHNQNVGKKYINTPEVLRTGVKQSGGQTIVIKMEGNNYDYDSAVKAIEQVISIKSEIKKFEQIINKQWDEGVVLKTVDLETETTSYTTIKYENLYRKEQKEESDTGIKISILRLFFNLSDLKTNIGEFSPILVKHIKKGSVGGAYTHGPDVVSDDYRRTILSVAVTELNPNYDEDNMFTDTHFILKMTSNRDYEEAYIDEVKIYKELQENNLVEPRNIVKYYGSGEYHYTFSGLNIGEKITISTEQWNTVMQQTVGINTQGFYILLENTLGYYDYEDYVKLKSKDVDDIDLSESFNNIYSALYTVYSDANFFHGDFHNRNVKINKDLHVKLFDFDFSCIIPFGEKERIISQNILVYDLIYPPVNKENPIFPDHVPKERIKWYCFKNFLFCFDIFRLWLSTRRTISIINKRLNRTTTSNYVLQGYISTYEKWFKENKENNEHGNIFNEWDKYFMNTYFYENIWIHTDDFKPKQANTEGVQRRTYGCKIVNRTSYEDKFGGNRKAIPKTNYKKHGKYDVVINDVKLKMRVIWKHNRQFYIKRRDGSFERINKKSIHS